MINNIHTVTLHWVEQHFMKVVHDVIQIGKHFVVEMKNQPALVIMSITEYERMRKEALLWQFYEYSRQAGLEASNESMTDDELMADIQAIKEEIYAMGKR